MPETSYTVIIYRDPVGAEPFSDWLHNLRDSRTRRRILQRLLRLENGNFGDCKSVGAGVSELRFFFGPGYRVDFGQDRETIVALLCGGDKSSQRKDVRKAQTYWKEYKSHE